MGVLGGGNVVGLGCGCVVVVMGEIRRGVDLELAGEAEAAYCAAMLLALSCVRTFCSFVKTDAWRGAAASKDGVVSGPAVDLFVVKIIWDARTGV